MKVVFNHAEMEAPNISTLYFKPEADFLYIAGQYVELTLKHPHPDNRGEKRRFTLSSSPTDELLSVTNKFAAKDGSSFKRALKELHPGDVLLASQPMGDFVLPENAQTPLIFVAGGIGITPFRSMVSWLQATGQTRPIQLFFAVNGGEEALLQPVFAQVVQKLTVVVRNPLPAREGERGYLTAKRILHAEKPSPDTLIYLSGSETMVASLQAELLKAGVAAQQLVLDPFTGYTAA